MIIRWLSRQRPSLHLDVIPSTAKDRQASPNELFCVRVPGLFKAGTWRSGPLTYHLQQQQQQQQTNIHHST